MQKKRKGVFATARSGEVIRSFTSRSGMIFNARAKKKKKKKLETALFSKKKPLQQGAILFY
jgi:hypothetical protein